MTKRLADWLEKVSVAAFAVGVFQGSLLGLEGVRLPGERRFMLRERNRVSGVNLPEALYNDLRKRAGVA